MSKLINNPLDLKGSLLKTKNNTFDFNIEEEFKEIPPIEETEEAEAEKTEEKKATKQNKTETKKEETKQIKNDIKKARTYRLPQKLINDIDIIVYMDRELRGNETTLITKALENYVYNAENKKLLQEYKEKYENKNK